MINKTMFEENGVDRVHFYNVKTPITDNALTVCVFYNTAQNRIEARGVAICSLLDSFSMVKGKQKSFGRAMKALKRKQNFYKINGTARSDEFVRREMKIKSEEDDRNFRANIAAELRKIDPTIPVKIVMANGNSKYMKKYIYDVPLAYPIAIANQSFKYKSQYRPAPVGEAEFAFLQTECDGDLPQITL